MSEITECYELLGCRYGENLRSVKKKFIELSLIHHPDKGGEKEFFDEICKAYRRIREIRKFESFPDENIDYKINEDIENDTVVSKEEFLEFVKGIEANLSEGYNDYNRNIDFDVDLSKKMEYNPNDVQVEYSEEHDPKKRKIPGRDPNNIDAINYSGRDTDSKQYFGLVKYGELGTLGKGKGGVECYDLGSVFGGLSVDPPPSNDSMESVDSLMEKKIAERGNVTHQPPLSSSDIEEHFEKSHVEYLDKCRDEFMSNMLYKQKMLGK